MSLSFNRRRFLSISAAFALTAGTARASEVIRWHGRALGAKTSMILTGLDATQAQPIFRAVEQELSRLESIFSLYRDDSEITQLNATGTLSAPSPEMLDVLSLSSALNKASDGAFDPTVQPVWQALAQGKDPQQAQEAVGWDNLRFDTQRAAFTRPGMGITLNGIAQGYVTDKIAALLRRRGLENVLIDMGEIAAIGTRPDGRDWQAKISRPDGVIVHHVALRDRALATSAPLGTILTAEGNPGHIIDPRNVSAVPKRTLASVSAPHAAVADGLSTACCLLDRESAQSVIAKFTGAELEQII
jgi:FAD:protein FMN transferase